MAGHAKHQQAVELRLVCDRKFQSHGERVFLVAVTHVRDVFAVQRSIQCLHDAGLADAEKGRFIAIDRYNDPRRGGFDTVVDIHDVVGPGE